MTNDLISTLGILRDLKPDEIEIMLAWRNAPQIRKNMYTKHEISIEGHISWWNRTKDRLDQKYFMYEYKGIPSGIVSINNIDLLNKNSSWAFYSSPEAPKGTGGRMEYLALEYVFGKMLLNKLFCEVLAFNNSVIRLHEKFGFKIEGIFREQHKFDDQFVDIYRMGILASNWELKREEMCNKISSY